MKERFDRLLQVNINRKARDLTESPLCSVKYGETNQFWNRDALLPMPVTDIVADGLLRLVEIGGRHHQTLVDKGRYYLWSVGRGIDRLFFRKELLMKNRYWEELIHCSSNSK